MFVWAPIRPSGDVICTENGGTSSARGTAIAPITTMATTSRRWRARGNINNRLLLIGGGLRRERTSEPRPFTRQRPRRPLPGCGIERAHGQVVLTRGEMNQAQVVGCGDRVAGRKEFTLSKVISLRSGVEQRQVVARR